MLLRFRRDDTDLTIELRFIWDDKVPVWLLDVREANEPTRQRRFEHDRERAFTSLHDAADAAQRDGWVLVIDGVVVDSSEVTFSTELGLEKTVDGQPNDIEAWEVLIDAWLEADDPRGHLASIGRVAVSDPGEFLRRRQASERARLQAVGSLYGPLESDGYRVDSRFEAGLVHELRFDLEQNAPGRSWAELTSDVLEHPMCRFVRELSAKVAPGSEIVRALARCRPTSLRMLRLHSTTTVDLSKLAAAAPNIVTLDVSSHRGVQGTPKGLTHLESLTLRSQWSLEEMTALLRSLASLGRLATVELEDWSRSPAKDALVAEWLDSAKPLEGFRYNQIRTGS